MFGRQDRIIRRLALTRVVATLKSGETLEGLVKDIDKVSIQLVDVRAHLPNAEAPLSVDGAVVLARCDIAYLQLP